MVRSPHDPQKSRDTRRAIIRGEIIEKAAALIGERGYRAVTVDDIAEVAGISKPTFYAYLENKDKILWEIYEVIRVESLKLAKVILTSKDSAPEKLRKLIRGHIAHLVAKREFYAVFFRDEVEFPTRLKNRHRTAQKEYRHMVEEIFRQCIQEGILPAVDPTIATLGLLGMCNWVARWYQPGGTSSPDEIADTFYLMLVGSSVPMLATVDGARACKDQPPAIGVSAPSPFRSAAPTPSPRWRAGNRTS